MMEAPPDIVTVAGPVIRHISTVSVGFAAAAPKVTDSLILSVSIVSVVRSMTHPPAFERMLASSSVVFR